MILTLTDVKLKEKIEWVSKALFALDGEKQEGYKVETESGVKSKNLEEKKSI